jgi:hypothetical protein
MKTLRLLPFWMLIAFCFFSVGLFVGAFAQQNAEKLPADVYPDTLCRIPRLQRGDFSSESEKRAFDRVLALAPTFQNLPGTWLGPAGIRLQIPELEVIYLEQMKTIRESTRLDEKYLEIATLVATREFNNKSEFLDHATREVTEKLVSPKVVETIKNEGDTNGLEEREAAIIKFGRELFHEPKVSSQTFATMERLFGRKETVGITLLMTHYSTNELLFRAYDVQLFRRAGEKAPSPPW